MLRFEVYSDTKEDRKLDKKDELLGEMGEVKKGVYQMDDLRYSKYLVREKTALTGFVLDENVYSVSIEENGQSAAKSRQNILKKNSTVQL